MKTFLRVARKVLFPLRTTTLTQKGKNRNNKGGKKWKKRRKPLMFYTHTHTHTHTFSFKNNKKFLYKKQRTKINYIF
jgi:hypothetical protein